MSKHSILVVDDDVQFGRFVKRVVSSMGHAVEQLSSPREIMDLYDKFAPDIIMLDIFMPEFDGMEVANWLSQKGFDGTLVFMTGHNPAFLSTAKQVVEKQSDAHVATLEKPVRVSEIRELLNRSLVGFREPSVGPDEKRASSRMKTLKAGKIVYQNDSCTMDCMILDLSENGAKLKPIDAMLLPETFGLMIPHRSSHNCEIVRRTRDQVAVRFL